MVETQRVHDERIRQKPRPKGRGLNISEWDEGEAVFSVGKRSAWNENGRNGERSGLHDHRSGLKAALAKTFNDAPCIIRGTKLFIMDEVIKATVLPLLHVALAVQFGNDAMNDRQAAEKRGAAAYLGSLFTNRL